MIEVIGFMGILIALILFLVLVYKGWSSYWVAPICALIVAITNNLNFKETISRHYVGGLSNLIVNLFSIIFLGAILGKVFYDTKAADSIAGTIIEKLLKGKSGNTKIKVAFLSVYLVSGICMMGGIGAYVLTFTMFPICLLLAEKVDIPRRFIPGMISLGCAFLAAPGFPQLYNIISTTTLNAAGYDVSITSGMIPGIVSTLVISIGGFVSLYLMVKKAIKNGEHFEYGPIKKPQIQENTKLPNFFVALLPLASVFVSFAIFNIDIFFSLSIGIIVNLIFMGRNLPKKDNKGLKITLGKSIIKTLNSGAHQFPNALMTVIIPAGLAAVIMATPSFLILVKSLYNLDIHYIILTLLIVCIVVGLTSSPPAALLIAIPIVLSVVSEKSIEINPGAVSRIASISASTFESLPINGYILLTLSLSKTTHKESYKIQFIMTVFWTFMGALVASILLVLFPGMA